MDCATIFLIVPDTHGNRNDPAAVLRVCVGWGGRFARERSASPLVERPRFLRTVSDRAGGNAAVARPFRRQRPPMRATRKRPSHRESELGRNHCSRPRGFQTDHVNIGAVQARPQLRLGRKPCEGDVGIVFGHAGSQLFLAVATDAEQQLGSWTSHSEIAGIQQRQSALPNRAAPSPITRPRGHSKQLASLVSLWIVGDRDNAPGAFCAENVSDLQLISDGTQLAVVLDHGDGHGA
jgi:hypothetical protein